MIAASPLRPRLSAPTASQIGVSIKGSPKALAIDRRFVTLTLRDGKPDDADGVANGVIVDPAGIVEVEEESSGVVDNPSSTSIAGSGGSHRNGIGCFVATAIDSGVVEIPVSFFLSLIALLILLSLMHRARTRTLHQGLRRERCR